MKISIEFDSDNIPLFGRLLWFVRENGLSFSPDDSYEYDKLLMNLKDEQSHIVERLPISDQEKISLWREQIEKELSMITREIVPMIQGFISRVQSHIGEQHWIQVEPLYREDIRITADTLKEDKIQILKDNNLWYNYCVFESCGVRLNAGTDLFNKHYYELRIYLDNSTFKGNCSIVEKELLKQLNF